MKAKSFFPQFENQNELFYMFSLLEYDNIPIVFVCSDSLGKLYLCDCVEFRNYQKWVVSETNPSVLFDILNQKLSVFDALAMHEYCRVICFSYELSVYSQYTALFSSLSDEDLPKKGAMLRYHSSKAFDYLSMLTSLSGLRQTKPASKITIRDSSSNIGTSTESVSFNYYMTSFNNHNSVSAIAS